MKVSTAEEKARAHSENVIRALRAKADDVAATVMPTVASAAESAGNAMSDLAASARSFATSLRERDGSQSLSNSALIAQAAPLLRTAVRFAARNPWLVAVGGLAIVAVGYAIVRNSADAEDEAAERL